MPKMPIRNPGLVRFTGVLGDPKERWGGWSWVAFPCSPKDLYGVREWVPLVAIVDGHGFHSSIRRMGSTFGQPVVLIPKRI